MAHFALAFLYMVVPAFFMGAAFPIAGEARDNTYVRSVWVSVDGGAWQQAEGAETWTYDWDTAPLGEGWHQIRVRAEDPADNVGNAASIDVLIDRTGPALSLTAVRTKAIYDNDRGRYYVPLEGTVTDWTDGGLSALLQGEHVQFAMDTGDVTTVQHSGGGWQEVDYASAGGLARTWRLDYWLPTFDNDGAVLPAPTGMYTVSLRARDAVGNATDEAPFGVRGVDNRPPLGELVATGAYTDVIVGVGTVLTGTVIDRGPEALGVHELYLDFDRSEEQDGELYRYGMYHDFLRADLHESGGGVLTTTWSYTMTPMEGFYPVQLEAYDVPPYPFLGGRLSPWNGMVDTAEPRLKPYLYNQSVRYGPTDISCKVEDLNLDESTFLGCPCPKSTWQRTYFHEVNAWYRDVVSDTSRLVRITAHVFESNSASAGVLEKNGFVCEGHLRKHYLKDGRFFDGKLYALVR